MAYNYLPNYTKITTSTPLSRKGLSAFFSKFKAGNFSKAFLTLTSIFALALTTNAQNRVPSINLTAPGNNFIIYTNQAYTLRATASDLDGSITNVAFYSNSALLGRDSSAPYEMPVNTWTAGTYTIYAVATDNGGATKSSSVNTLVVRPSFNVANTAITLPYGAQAAANIRPSMTVQNKGNVAISEVTVTYQLDNGTEQTATLAANIPALGRASVVLPTYRNENGSHTLRVTITHLNGNTDQDNSDNTASLTYVSNVVNVAPSVTITSPAYLSRIFEGEEFTFSANASDRDGWVKYVAFYRGTALIGVDSTAPYTFATSDIPVGIYSITAVAVDDRNVSATSRATTLQVNAVYNVSSSGLRGVSGTITTSNISPMFVVTNKGNVTVTSMAINYTIDGGLPQTYNWTGSLAVNGVVIINLPTYRNENGNHTFSVTVSRLNGQTDGDASNNTLSSTYTSSINNAAPSVRITSPGYISTVFAGDEFTFAATASDRDGWITYVAFYRGNTLIGVDSTAPYTLAKSDIPVGTHLISARGFDDRGASGVSATTKLIVNPRHNVAISSLTGVSATMTTSNITTRFFLANLGKDELTALTITYQVDSNTAMTYNWTGSLMTNGRALVSLPAYRNENGAHTLTITAVSPNGVTDGDNSNNVIAFNYTSNVTNTAPTVRLLTPFATVTVPQGNNYTITATATDREGWVSKVEFYNGTTLIGTDSVAPYALELPNIAYGVYTITAKAYDDRNAVATTAAGTILVRGTTGLQPLNLRTWVANVPFINPFDVAPLYNLKNTGTVNIDSFIVGVQIDAMTETFEKIQHLSISEWNGTITKLLDVNKTWVDYYGSYLTGMQPGVHSVKIRIVKINNTVNAFSEREAVRTTFNYFPNQCPTEDYFEIKRLDTGTYSDASPDSDPTRQYQWRKFLVPTDMLLNSKLYFANDKDYYHFNTTNEKPNARIKVQVPVAAYVSVYEVVQGTTQILAGQWVAANDSFVYNLNQSTGKGYGLYIESKARTITNTNTGQATVIPAQYSASTCYNFIIETGANTFGSNISNDGNQPTALVTKRDENITAMSVYPNPTPDFTVVHIEAKEAGDYQFALTDMIGKTMQSKTLNLVKGENRMELDVTQMPAGIYFVSISRNGINITKKLVVGQ